MLCFETDGCLNDGKSCLCMYVCMYGSMYVCMLGSETDGRLSGGKSCMCMWAFMYVCVVHVCMCGVLKILPVCVCVCVYVCMK